jgi:hypothetical protein
VGQVIGPVQLVCWQSIVHAFCKTSQLEHADGQLLPSIAESGGRASNRTG